MAASSAAAPGAGAGAGVGIGAPLYSFGLIADVQYSTHPDAPQPGEAPQVGQVGWARGSGPAAPGAPWPVVTDAQCARAYRGSLGILQRAVASWRAQGLPAAVVLGDLLDKTAARRQPPEVDACLAAVKAALAGGPPAHVLFGNNDGDVLGRERWVREGLAPPAATPARLYHAAAPAPGVRLVFLDTYDESVGSASSEAARARALAHLRSVNPHLAHDAEHPGALPAREPWDARKFAAYPGRFPEGGPVSLTDAYATQTYNGQPGAAQMAWLQQQLAAAQASSERVFVFAHCPAHPFTCKPDGLAWNHAALRELLERHSCVQAYIAGHDHDGGYFQSPAGVHYLVPPAPLECAAGQVAFGAVAVGQEAWVLHWEGKVPAPGGTLRGGAWPMGVPLPYRAPLPARL